MRAMALAMVRAAAAVLVVRTAVLIDARMRLLERRVSTVVMVRAAAAAMVRAVAAEAMVRAAAVIGDPPLERPQLANRRPSTRTAIGPVPVPYVGPFWCNFPGLRFHASLVWVSWPASKQACVFRLTSLLACMAGSVKGCSANKHETRPRHHNIMWRQHLHHASSISVESHRHHGCHAPQHAALCSHLMREGALLRASD